MSDLTRRDELVRGLPATARVLLALCRKNVPSPVYESGSYEPTANRIDPLKQLTGAFPQFTSYLAGKSVLDFGCAEGEQSRAMIRAGARSVHGLDINSAAIQVAIERSRGIPDLAFSDRMPVNAKFDIIITQNAFEHFIDAEAILRQMSEVLAQEGKIFVTFGPTWYSPWGAHIEYFCRVPWVHLWFSESTITTVRRIYRTDGASNYTEMGLAKMSLRKFRRLVAASGFAVEYSRLNCVRGLNLLRLTPMREFFVSQVNCVLSRQSFRLPMR